MPARLVRIGTWASIALAGLAHAHMAPFHPSMFCFNGTDPKVVNINNNAPVSPLYELPYDQFWMHADNGCNKFPPDEGVFLDIPAGKSFTLEIAENRAFTSYGHPHFVPTAWGDGKNHPDNYSITNLGGFPISESGCLSTPNLHTKDQAGAAGTAFAIAYESDISKVTPQNLVVFTVRYHTPWKLRTTYDVPSGMRKCPKGGCICVFLWVPKACGQANSYMFPYRCQVIPDATPPKTIGTPQPPQWCEDDESKCVKGPKQMIIWHQKDSNNIDVQGLDLSGNPKSPAYNMKCGFKDGAQDDIFVESHSKRMQKRRGESFAL